MGLGMDTDSRVDNGSAQHEQAVQGIKSILTLALEQEVNEIIAKHADMKDDQGHRLVVRNGKGRARKIVYQNGAFEISAPRINDRRKGKRFKSRILPSYSRRLNNIDSTLELLRTRGLNRESFDDAVGKLFSNDGELLSPDSISSMREAWLDGVTR
ncbi:MAG: transposase [Pseudomonadota bacterium]|nr:transposase [Pseudomonadota bacterium]